MNKIHAKQTIPRPTRGFTLTELVVVATTIVIVLLVIAPALQAASEKSKTQICLDNLRMLGIGVHIYIEEYGDTLPGPIFTAIRQGMLRDDGDMMYQYTRETQLAWKLYTVMGSSMTDRLVTCPTAAQINPDRNFTDVGGRNIYPTHYALNNIGTMYSNSYRGTNPPYYFGLQVWPSNFEPAKLGTIPNADREWMIADAWYREGAPFPANPELQQEGPFQTGWTGEALPNFAPHENRSLRSYCFTSTEDRDNNSYRIRQAKADGITNTLYFDGHAAGVVSRTLSISGWDIMYGFPGTVNPHTPLPPEAVWR